MIYTKRNGTLVEYYTRKEATSKGLHVIPWREATKAKQWLLTDDGYVLQSVRVKYLNEMHGKKIRTRRKIVTGLAIRYPHGKRPLILQEHLKARSYGIVPQPWYQAFDTQYPAIRSLLVKLVLQGRLRMTDNRRYNREEYAELIAVAKQIFDTHHMSWYNVRTFFGREEVRAMIKDDIKALALTNGVSHQKVFDLLNEAIVMGRNKGDGKVLIAVAKEYAAILGMPQAMKEGQKQLPPTGGAPELPGSETSFDRILERKAMKDATEAKFVDVPAAT